MRQLKETEIVRARVRQSEKTYPGFALTYDDILWRLRREHSLGERIGEQIQECNPPTYVIETAAMRSLGVPRIKLVYSDDGATIEVKTLAVY